MFVVLVNFDHTVSFSLQCENQENMANADGSENTDHENTDGENTDGEIVSRRPIRRTRIDASQVIGVFKSQLT